MADFPTALTNAVDGSTDVLAKHINNIEAKVGIDSSAVNTSHDYKLSLVTSTAKAVPNSYLDTDTSLAANSDVKIATQKATKAYVDTNVGILTSSKFGPEGFLINGKIVVSVASNNLTVAIKGMDGNDPSASNVVYARVGGSVRSITAALSVTKNAGTNWCNSGGAALATKEVDYFVYLGYNATDGVVLGFSRYPGANQYSDFSTTTTDEKYCAISTITTAASTDYYNIIGRFAATLSAGAGYTWTVPTFTAKNLIQYPIYETRWLDFTPTYGATGSMTWGTISTTYSQYKIALDQMLVKVKAIGTTGGSASSSITATLPFNPIQESYQPVTLYNNGVISTGLTRIDVGSATVTIQLVPVANFTLAANTGLLGSNIVALV